MTDQSSNSPANRIEPRAIVVVMPVSAIMRWNASGGSERPAAQARIGLGGAELRAAF